MSDHIERYDLIRFVAHDVGTVEAVVDAFLDEIYQAIKRGQGVTLKGFSGFSIRPECEGWVFKFNPSQKLRALFGRSSTNLDPPILFPQERALTSFSSRSPSSIF
jgi:DNA-binding protein HU-beta